MYAAVNARDAAPSGHDRVDIVVGTTVGAFRGPDSLPMALTTATIP